MLRYFITIFVLTILWIPIGKIYIWENSYRYYQKVETNTKYALRLSIALFIFNLIAIFAGILFFRETFPKYLVLSIICNIILSVGWFSYCAVKKKPWDIVFAAFTHIPLEISMLTGYFAAAGNLHIMRISIIGCCVCLLLSAGKIIIQKKEFDGNPIPIWDGSMAHLALLTGLSFLPIFAFRIIILLFFAIHVWILAPAFDQCLCHVHMDYDEYYIAKPLIFVTIVELMIAINI